MPFASLSSRAVSRRRFLLMAAPVVAATSLIAACGPSAPSTPAAAPAAPKPTPAAAAAAPAVTTAPAAAAAGQVKTLTVAVEQDASSLKPDTWGPYLNWYAARTLYDTLL